MKRGRTSGDGIAVDVAVAKRSSRKRSGRAMPRLRFDKVVVRFIADLRSGLRDHVPPGKAVVVTCTAPIRLATKTAAELGEKLRGRSARAQVRSGFSGTIHGNRVRAQVVTIGRSAAPAVIGFVHDPGTEADALIERARVLAECVSARSPARVPSRTAGKRWLVVVDGCGGSYFGAYRWAYSQMRALSGYERVVVIADGRVEDIGAPARPRRSRWISTASDRPS